MGLSKSFHIFSCTFCLQNKIFPVPLDLSRIKKGSHPLPKTTFNTLVVSLWKFQLNQINHVLFRKSPQAIFPREMLFAQKHFGMHYIHLLLNILKVPVRELGIITLLKSQLGKPRHIESSPRVTNKSVLGPILDQIVCD